MWSRANRSRAVAVSTHGRWRYVVFFFFSSRRRHTRCSRDWSSDVCSSDLERLCALGLTVVEVPTGRLGARPLLATVRLIRRLGIEVVHTHGKGAGLHGRLAARWTGAAAVHTFHGIHYESYPRPLQRLYLGLERRLARWTHTAIHVSPTQAAEAQRLGLTAAGGSATVVNGVDLHEQDQRLAASPLPRARLGLAPDWAVLGSVARFDPVKRLDAPVGALRFLNRPDVPLLLVGDGPQAVRLRRRVAAAGLRAPGVFARRARSTAPPRRPRLAKAVKHVTLAQ